MIHIWEHGWLHAINQFAANISINRLKNRTQNGKQQRVNEGAWQGRAWNSEKRIALFTWKKWRVRKGWHFELVVDPNVNFIVKHPMPANFRALATNDNGKGNRKMFSTAAAGKSEKKLVLCGNIVGPAGSFMAT